MCGRIARIAVGLPPISRRMRAVGPLAVDLLGTCGDMRGLLGGYCAGTWWADAWMPSCAVEAVEKGGCTVKSRVDAYIEAL
jgi:hypothetical protein